MLFNQSDFDHFLVTQGCIVFHNPPIQLECGRRSWWDIDLQSLYSSLRRKHQLAQFIYAYAQDCGLRPDFFLGVPMRAIPLGENVNELIDYRDKQQIPATILRADFKNGRSPKERYAIGPLYAGQHVVLIDDTVVTGTSCMRYIPRLQEVGVVVDGVIACVHRLEKQDNGRVVHELLKEAYGVTLYSLTDVRTLLPTAIQLMEVGSEMQRCLETYYQKYGVQSLQLCP